MTDIKSPFSFANSKLSNAPTNNMMSSLPQMQTLEKYNCEKCRFSTKDLNKYKIHIALHNEMKYVCSHCNFESYTKAEFQKHLVTHTGKFPFTCGYCGYGAIRNDYIMKHIKRIHGDGKIQCSVSTIENESKNTSINIMQAQILQNTTFPSKNVIDLTTEVDNSTLNSNGYCLNGNTFSNAHADHVEVEVISPVDQQLYPWMPLRVVAPTSFRVPENCLVQVLDVKSVNSICHLVLKCLEVSDSNLPNVDLKENLCEQNTSEPMVSSEKSLGSSNGPSLQEGALLNGTESLLHGQNTVTLTEENSNNNSCSPLNENESNTLNAPLNELPEEMEEFSDGPIISSVFSLSSDQNVIEGIQWESPTTDVTASKDIFDTTISSNVTDSQGASMVLGTEASWQMESGKSDKQKTFLQTEMTQRESVKVKNTDPEIQLPLGKSALPHGRKPEGQTPALAQNNKRAGSKSNRLIELETDLFVKPQTLFLSCDKRIVMQPLSCVMQTGQRAGPIRDKELVPLKVRNQSAKVISKVISKRFAAPAMKTLRLYPAKPDQLTDVPHKNQPVVVLNHPELESLQTYSIMKAISMFKGRVLKVTLPKQIRRRLSRT